jgi:hypothetical protein
MSSTRSVTIADDLAEQISHPGRGQTQQGHRDDESGNHDERRWLTVQGHDGSSVHVAVLQHETDAEVVWLYAEHGANLTPAQARSASQALLEAASCVEEHHTA